MSVEKGGDRFNEWFKAFSTEHSWYKCWQCRDFIPIPNAEHDSRSGVVFENPPWPWHLSDGGLDIPPAVVRMLEAYPTPMTGLIYGHHGRGHGLHMSIEHGGWAVLDKLKAAGHHEASAFLRASCKEYGLAGESHVRLSGQVSASHPII